MTTLKKKEKTNWALPLSIAGMFIIPAVLVAFSDSARQKVVATGLRIFNKDIEHHLKQLHPAVRERFRALVQAWQDAGFDVIITSSYRNLLKQAAIALKSSIASKGLSWHNFGMAFDVNLVKGKTHLKLASPKKAWLDSGAVQIAYSLGFRWGGDFMDNYDPVHFDTGYDYDRDKLYAAAVHQFGTNPENFQGNQTRIS